MKETEREYVINTELNIFDCTKVKIKVNVNCWKTEHQSFIRSFHSFWIWTCCILTFPNGAYNVNKWTHPNIRKTSSSWSKQIIPVNYVIEHHLRSLRRILDFGMNLIFRCFKALVIDLISSGSIYQFVFHSS